MAASKPPVNKLYNSILDTVLVYGLDEHTRGLNIDQQGTIQDDYEKLLTRDINVQFLQVLAPGVVHPNRSSNKTGSATNVYPSAGTPSGDKSLADGVGINKRFRMEDLGLVWETVESLHHFLYPDGCQLHATEREPACVPVVLTNILGTRTYAMAIKFTRPFFIEKPSDVRSGHYNLLPWTGCMSSLSGTPTNSKLIYLPTAIVMVSKLPYFRLLKEALSGMYRLLSEEEREDSFWETIEDVANKLFLIPCLPEGLLSLEVTLPGFSSPTIIMPPRGDLHLDVRLNYPFLCLSVDNVLKVIAALLSEQTIVFTSSNYSMPALVIQCLLSYISPFEWRHSIVPTVPDNFIDILGAPSINILGCHSNWHESPEFTNIDDAVIVKLDEDVVESKLSSLSSFPELPEADRMRFKTQYQEILVGDYEVDSLERLVLPSAIERERRKSNFEHYKDTTLSALFLELMVRVFDSIVQDLKKSRAVFEEHLNSLPEKEQFFYRIATQTDMFSLFMMSRRLGVRDNFSILADQVKKYLRPARSVEGDSLVSQTLPSNVLPLNPLTRRSRLSIVNAMLSGQSLKPNIVGTQSLLRHQTIIEDKMGPFISWSYSKTSYFKDLQCLILPQFENKPIERGKYIETVLSLLDDMIADKSIQANCMYLCGYYHIASGNVLKGLEILCDDLKRLNSNIVPTLQQRMTFVSLLSPEEKEALEKKSFYKDLIPRQVFQDGYGRHPSNALAFRKIGSHKKTLSHNEFSKEMTQENVTKDPESVSNLFSILQSVNHSASVSVELFQAFLESWKQVVQEYEKASQMMKAQDPILGVTERILVYNSNLRTNAGSHCQVFLTTHRILVQTQSGGALNKDKVFGVLSEMNLSSFCKSEISLTVFSPKVPIIKFDCLDQSMASSTSGTRNRVTRITARASKMTDVYIAFPDVVSQELWYRLLKEAIAGWQKFTARKDATVMDHVESHTRLLLALFRTGWTDEVDTNVRHKWCQKILSLQSKPVVIDVKATEALLYRINPNTYNIEKATIESTLFVPRSVTGGEGKLWFGLGNGVLRVYDMEDRCFDSDLKIMDSRRGKTVRVSCLLLVDYNVWVGSLNKTIHILDVETLCHVSQLSNLEDEPRDLALSKSEPMIVWSLLLNGTVLGFDPETRERVAKITVPNMLQHTFCTCFTVYRDFLWVGTNRGTISILSTEYSEQQLRNEIAFTESGKTVEVKYLAVSSEDEIWCSVHAIPRAKDSTFIAVYNPRNNTKIYSYSNFKGNDRVSFILPVKNTVWCGTKSGKIYVFSARTENNRDGPKILDAHDDKVRSMTYTDNDLVISGSGSSDGYANVWKLMNWFDE